MLAGFAAAQRGLLDQKSRRYLALNLVGSGILAADAVFERQWGLLWILAGLNARKDESVQTAIERLSADVQRLRELVA